jgi:transcriptional regulator with XRE-family HTH domain
LSRGEFILSVFSERLSFLRRQKHISQEAFSKEIGISNRAYQYYETGTREPTLSVAAKIADFYGVSLDYLAGRSEEK